jgi:putative heme-binding domain-containing protein
MHYDLPLAETNMLDARPTQGAFGIPAARIVAPGDPFRSVLWYRMSKLGGGRMPHIGSGEVDRDGVDLIHDWIKRLPADGEAVIEDGEIARLRRAQANSDQAAIVEELLASTSTALRLLRSIDEGSIPEAAAAMAIEEAAASDDPSIRDLFERFLPPERRIQRLGAVVQPEQILALAGDAAVGRRLFFETSTVVCKNCHRIQDVGKEVGPDLSDIGRRLSREQLLESMLEPSKLIDPKYVTWQVETDDGRLLSGVLLQKDEREIVLKDAEGAALRIATENVELAAPQAQSLMPELLLRDLTAQQVADLLEFLASLK